MGGGAGRPGKETLGRALGVDPLRRHERGQVFNNAGRNLAVVWKLFRERPLFIFGCHACGIALCTDQHRSALLKTHPRHLTPITKSSLNYQYRRILHSQRMAQEQNARLNKPLVDQFAMLSCSTPPSSPHRNPEASKLIVDPNGDTLLLVGSKGNQRELQVSSKTLSLGSPVFLAMFSSRFLEGSPTESGGPRTVPFPDDDPEAMTTLCDILHFQSQHVTLAGFQAFESLAIVCDKYDCSRALKPWTALWLQRWPGSSGGEDDYFKMMHVGYAYGLDTLFHKATLHVFQNWPAVEVQSS